MPRQKKKAARQIVPDVTRKKIVEAVMLEQHTKTEAAKRFGYAFSTIDSIIRTFEEEGRWERLPPVPPRRTATLSDIHLDHAVNLIEDNPTLTLQEIKEGIMTRFPDNVEDFSVQTLSRALGKRRHITLKRTHIEMIDLNEEGCVRDRTGWLGSLHTEQTLYADALFFDEAGFNLHTTRSVGCARVGRRAMVKRPSAQGPNLSLLVAVDRHGVQASETILRSWKSKSYVQFLRDQVLPYAGQSWMFVMDNASIHRTQEVRDLIHAAGHRIKLLPPYTPHFNLAEWVFGYVKPLVGRCNPQDRSSLTEYIDDGLRNIGPEKAGGWIKEVLTWQQVATQGGKLGELHDAADAKAQIEAAAHAQTERNSYDDDARAFDYLNIPQTEDQDDSDDSSQEDHAETGS